MTTPSNEAIETALESGDTVSLSRFLDGGLDIDWRDETGNSLLHHAARIGDAPFIATLLGKGAKVFTLNDALETPRDVAIVWGNDAAAAQIAIPLARDREASARKIPYGSLQEIRDASAQDGVNRLYVLARSGEFAQVVALAEKDQKGLSAEDLLSQGPGGDSVILAIAQQGDLKQVMKPALWSSRPDEFQTVWQAIPAQYKKGMDHEGFISTLRQERIKSYGKPKLPGLKP